MLDVLLVSCERFETTSSSPDGSFFVSGDGSIDWEYAKYSSPAAAIAAAPRKIACVSLLAPNIG